jgi:hypothetical protein
VFSGSTLTYAESVLSDTEVPPKCAVAVLNQLGQSLLRFGLVTWWYADAIFDEIPDEEE